MKTFSEFLCYIEEKALSKSQQRLFGMVHAYQKGKLKNAPEEVKKIAKGIKNPQINYPRIVGPLDKIRIQEFEEELDNDWVCIL